MEHTTQRPLKRVYGIVPPTGKYIREDRCQTPIDKLKTVSLRPPIDLLYAAASFESAGCEVRIDDYPAQNLAWPDLEARLREFQPDALLLSITTPSLELDMQAAEVARRVDPGILTLAKGAHFNTLDQKTIEQFPQIDVVLRGEYEHTCMELGRGLPIGEIAGITWRDDAGRPVRNADRPFPKDLDTIPYPARHLIDNTLYARPDNGALQTTLVTNRGCPFHCIYCLANQVSGTQNRYRSVENVMGEIRECVDRHGIRNFLFRSDLFTQNKKWVIELCQAILDSGLDIDWACNSRVDTITPEALEWMKKAGCWIIALGVESGDAETLRLIDKGGKASAETAIEAVRMIRAAGIRSSVYLLMGLPWDTPELIDRQVAFAKQLDPDVLEIFYVYPFPGTPLYEVAVREGLIQDGDIPREAYGDPSMPGLHLTAEEFGRLRRRALRQYYLRPRVILRTLSSVRSPGELVNYIRRGVGQLLTS